MTVTMVRRYTPRGAALDLFAHRDREVVLAGPAGTGKSRACLEKVHHMLLVNPGAKALMVRKVGRTLADSCLQTFKRHVAAEAIARGIVTYYGGSRVEPAQWRYSNGATIAMAGMDDPLKIMSTEYDLIFVEEAIELTLPDWRALITRLRNGVTPYQQILASTNPGPATHWLRQRCMDGKATMLESRHEDNPEYVQEDGTLTEAGLAYIGPGGTLDALDGVERQRLKDGQWVSAAGVIYDRWDPRVHVVAFEVHPDWPRFLAIDFGFTNPFVCQWWAEDPDGRLYLYRELYRTEVLVEDHARRVRELTGDERITRVVCDHDAEGRATFKRHSGFSTTPAKKDVREGIQAVAARLRPGKDRRPRLFIHPDALVERDQGLRDAGKPTCTAEEIPAYVWDTSTDARRDREAPVKADDHGCDAMRYMVANRDLRGRPNVRFLDQ